MKNNNRSDIDAIKFLKADHKEVTEMFERFESRHIRRDSKHKLAKDICDALILHAQIEEEILYPALRNCLEGDNEELVDVALVEHASIKDIISKIEGGFYDDLLEAQINVLSKWVSEHVSEEEKQLFPKLKSSDIDLKLLGAKLAQRKEELKAGFIERASAWVKSTITALSPTEEEHDGVEEDDGEDEEAYQEGGNSKTSKRHVKEKNL